MELFLFHTSTQQRRKSGKRRNDGVKDRESKKKKLENAAHKLDAQDNQIIRKRERKVMKHAK